jgi:hypothetical protein
VIDFVGLNRLIDRRSKLAKRSPLASVALSEREVICNMLRPPTVPNITQLVDELISE